VNLGISSSDHLRSLPSAKSIAILGCIVAIWHYLHFRTAPARRFAFHVDSISFISIHGTASLLDKVGEVVNFQF